MKKVHIWSLNFQELTTLVLMKNNFGIVATQALQVSKDYHNTPLEVIFVKMATKALAISGNTFWSLGLKQYYKPDPIFKPNNNNTNNPTSKPKRMQAHHHPTIQTRPNLFNITRKSNPQNPTVKNSIKTKRACYCASLPPFLPCTSINLPRTYPNPYLVLRIYLEAAKVSEMVS